MITPDTTVCPSDIPETPYGFRKRMQFVCDNVRKHINEHKDKNAIRILDVGCGAGELLTIPLGNIGVEILGIDIHPLSISHARERNTHNNVKFECKNIDQLSAKPSYDVIICSEVLEHVPEPQDLLFAMKKRLKEDGICVVTIPNGYGPKEMEIRFWKLLESLGVIKILRFLKHLIAPKNRNKENGNKGSTFKDTLNLESPHIQFFSYKKFQKMVETSGFFIEKQHNRRFLSGPLSDRFLLKSNRLVNWNVRIANILPYYLVSSWMFILKIKDAADSRRQ